MKRKLEMLDVLVAIGMVATVLGGYLLFQASYGGALAVMTPTQAATNPSSRLMVQAMLQPEIGQTIIDHATVENQFATDVLRHSRQLYHAWSAAEHNPIGGLNTIEPRANQFKADHDARVQYVLGKTIVTLTGQGMRSGALSADNLSNTFNDRIIATAQAKGQLMESAFAKNWQTRLGNWIVDAAKKEQRFTGHVQERIGQGIVDLASTQDSYLAKSTETQNQLTALTAASARMRTQPGQFIPLGRTDVTMAGMFGIQTIPRFEISGEWTLSEIPFSYMLGAFLGLVLVFFIGLLLPKGRRELENVVEHIERVRREIFRKVA